MTCPEWALNLLSQTISMGLASGRQRLTWLFCFVLSYQVFVSSQEGEDKAAVLEIHHLHYLALTPLPACLPTREFA